jgi:hypothetical protein
MGTCAALGGRMSSPELRESSARMLRVTGDQWPKNVPIPRATSEDMFTSRMARDLKIFPYRRNIATVVSAVMEKNHQDTAQKRRAVFRIGDSFREAKKVRGGRGARSLLPPAAANRRWLRSRPPLGPGSLRQVRRLLLLARASHPWASWRRGKSCPHHRVLTRRRRVLLTSTQISTWGIILVVSFFRLGHNQNHGAGSDVGQLAVVPTPVVATSSTVAVGAKGASQDPWSAFCASGTIPSAAATKDVAGSVSRQLRQALQQLSQQLKHVSHVGLR